MQEVMIQDISYDEKRDGSLVTLIQGFKHKYSDGDQVILKEVVGMLKIDDPLQSINNSV